MAMYHRIYRLAKRDTDPQQIAVTLDLPLKTVQSVLERFKSGQGLNGPLPKDSPAGGSMADPEGQETYLDVYVIPRGRYVILDFNGDLTGEHAAKLEHELDEIRKAQWKSVALMMANVRRLDQGALDVIYAFRDRYVGLGRYTAILDPSRDIEPSIEELKVFEMLRIFGTEKAFEDSASSTTREIEMRKKTTS